MPFHPKLEFALNRLGILGSGASDELALLHDENFEDMLKLSVASISNPQQFQNALKQERITALKKLECTTTHQIQQRQFFDHLQEEGGIPHHTLTAGVNDEEAQFRDVTRRGDDDEEEEEEEEEDEELRVEKEAQRMRNELKQMSLVALDSLRLGIDIVPVKKNNNDATDDQQQEPEVKISNAALLRFVLTVLSDSQVAATLRIPLLQGDLPLLARSVLRSCCYDPTATTPTASSSANNNNTNNDPEFAKARNSIVFLCLDMLATMCADSAACRLACSCCVPLIVQVLQTFVADEKKQPSSSVSTLTATAAGSVLSPQRANSNNNNNNNTNGLSSSSTTAAKKKTPVTFVRPTPTTNNAEAAPSSNNNNNSSNALPPPTTEDDVIFAGAAALETMLFHCPESVEAFFHAGGVKTWVALFRQSAEVQRKEQKLAETTSSGDAPLPKMSSATDTVSFLKRTLLHVRASGVIAEDVWSKILSSSSSSSATVKNPKFQLGSSSSSSSSSSSPACVGSGDESIFGRQGDDLAVDELKWALTGGRKIGRMFSASS